MKSILLLGKHGQISQYLQRCLAPQYALTVLSSQELDLSQPETVLAILQKYKNTDYVINPAAYTQVDNAEQDKDTARAINHLSVEKIAQFCADNTTPLIHFSTDYVFDGQKNTPYLETDAVAPLGVYGVSKLDGERAVLHSQAPAIILRTSWVYSTVGKNFYKTMLSLAQSKNELSVVNDQIGAPNYAGALAQATKKIVDSIQQSSLTDTQKGIFHLSCQGQGSWCDFAKAIFEAHDLRVNVQGIDSKAYPTPVQRPKFSVLDTQKLQRVFGITLPHWHDALTHCVSDT